MQIVSAPHLPQGKVCTAVSTVPIPGLACIPTVPISALPPALSVHADLQLCHLGGRYLLSCPEAYPYYREKLSPLGFEILCGEKSVGSTYPQDAAYNIVSMGRVAFCNEKTADPAALRFFAAHQIRSIFVKQGYTKCALMPLDAKTLITADGGIAKKARENGFDVLEIASGGIRLAGFPYGFIGGAGGKSDAHTVYLTGKLQAHPSYGAIVAFLRKKGIRLWEGNAPVPVDIGSVIPLISE